MSGKPWLRLYTSVLYDPKVQLLPPRLFKFWVNLLCLAAEHDGVLPNPSRVARALFAREPFTKRALHELATRSLIDVDEDGLMRVHNWSSRQYSSDSSTSRVREHRMKRFSNVTETVDETVDETFLKRPQNQNQNQSIKLDTNVSISEPEKARSISPIPKPAQREKGWIEQHALFDALVEIFGRPAGSGWSLWAREIKALDELGATPQQVIERAENYTAVMGTGPDGKPIVRTLTALVKHWHLCASVPASQAKPKPAGVLDVIRSAFGVSGAVNGQEGHHGDSGADAESIVDPAFTMAIEGEDDRGVPGDRPALLPGIRPAPAHGGGT